VASLFAAALFFDGIHFFISGTPIRGKIVGLIGERPFQGLFSLMSLIGIVWLSRAYGQAEYFQLWGKPQALRPVALIVMVVAFFFVVLAFTTPNPTSVGGGALLAEKEPAKGIQRITRHPFLWGVALWSFTHLALNGDLASVIFFGSFLILAVGGPFSIDLKQKKAFGDPWNRFAALTSNVLYGHRRGTRHAEDRRAGLVACRAGRRSVRVLSSYTQDSLRRLAVADVIGKRNSRSQVGLSSTREWSGKRKLVEDLEAASNHSAKSPRIYVLTVGVSKIRRPQSKF
jgi:uncharacterized membrane protein